VLSFYVFFLGKEGLFICHKKIESCEKELL